jgi:CoA:oxalate CoA-transferase
MYAATGILAALLRRGRTGNGDYIDISMLDVQVAMLGYQAAAYLQSGVAPGLQGRTHDSYALSYCVSASDGVDVMIAANQQKAFTALCKVVGRPELVEDARFATPQDRNRNKDAIRAIFDEACSKVPSSAIIDCLHKVGAPAAVINTIDRTFTEPQVLHRDMLMTLEGRNEADRVRVAGDPVKFTEAPRDRYEYPPHAGEHSRAVLKDVCGCDAKEIERLLASGVVLESPADEQTQEF